MEKGRQTDQGSAAEFFRRLFPFHAHVFAGHARPDAPFPEKGHHFPLYIPQPGLEKLRGPRPHRASQRGQPRHDFGSGHLHQPDGCRDRGCRSRRIFRTVESQLHDDPAANIGLRLTMNLAKEVTYTSAMRLNNVTIKV